MSDGLDDDWAEVLRIFPRPWKIHDVPDGGVWLEDATGKAILYIYHRRKDVANWKKPGHEKALVLVRRSRAGERLELHNAHARYRKQRPAVEFQPRI